MRHAQALAIVYLAGGSRLQLWDWACPMRKMLDGTIGGTHIPDDPASFYRLTSSKVRACDWDQPIDEATDFTWESALALLQGVGTGLFTTPDTSFPTCQTCAVFVDGALEARGSQEPEAFFEPPPDMTRLQFYEWLYEDLAYKGNEPALDVYGNPYDSTRRAT